MHIVHVASTWQGFGRSAMTKVVLIGLGQGFGKDFAVIGLLGFEGEYIPPQKKC